MKHIYFSVALFLSLFLSKNITAQNIRFFDSANQFFQAYAEHHMVKYDALHKNKTELQELVHQIQHIDLATLSLDAQKAFYINAYNILVIHTVIKHYPIESPNEIVEFWDGVPHNVVGKTFTLEELENYILATYKDPRIHFALCNGSMASAPITNVAYRPETLEEQLTQHVIGVVNNPQWITYQAQKAQLTLPLLFERHKASFQPDVVTFLNAYRVEQIKKPVTIVYKNEDWSLNAYHKYSTNSSKKKNVAKSAHNRQTQVITLPKGVAEFIDFNSIYTVGAGNKYSGTRNTYFNSYFTAFYGVTGKLDVGMSMLFRSSRERDNFSTSPFKVLDLERTSLYEKKHGTTPPTYYADFGLSHLGFQVRFAPFKNVNLSLEQSIMLPVRDLPKGNSVDQSLYAITQVYYIHPLTAKLQLFFALTYWQGIRPGEKFKFQLPLLRGFLNYFPNQRLSLFATSMYLLEWGAGVKYMLTPKLEMQIMYSYYLPIKGAYDILSPGASSIMTYNMGLRYRL